MSRFVLCLFTLGLLTFGAGPRCCAQWEGHEADTDEQVQHPFELENTHAWRFGALFDSWGEVELDDPSETVKPMATDRPDFTEASSTVGRGVFQIESGITYSRVSRNEQNYSWGEMLFRAGVYADWIELRAGISPVVMSIDGPLAGNHGGLEDCYLGAKFMMTTQRGWLPELSIVPQMTIPTGASSLTSGCTLPGCNVIYGWDITDTIRTAGSTQVNAMLSGGDRYLEWAQSGTVSVSLHEKLGAYGEWFAILPTNTQQAYAEYYIDGGFTYLVTEDIQLDARVGKGCNSAAADYFCGVGLSLRFR